MKEIIGIFLLIIAFEICMLGIMGFYKNKPDKIAIIAFYLFVHFTIIGIYLINK